MSQKSPRQPSHRLTFNEAIEVWLLYWDGWFQNRIAAKFDVNPGRISEVIHHELHPGSYDKALEVRGNAA
ncbi:hypothetical protein GCM10011503_16800 [Henriciella pelagia]|jgi:predicted XRE-type DNA-binding protein|uniref:Helix-turn-helix domain-containing protein n=1 Tax=Henriciella pelagia TaxID=1977912 RepID=A0ABQ1JH41_9PROT|nr:hypothetical protein GCM10011503_16800 [Henriciella pelagia]